MARILALAALLAALHFGISGGLPAAFALPAGMDFDGDGLANHAGDTDDDNDGVVDSQDPDDDDDGIRDGDDADDDNDGTTDVVDDDWIDEVDEDSAERSTGAVAEPGAAPLDGLGEVGDDLDDAARSDSDDSDHRRNSIDGGAGGDSGDGGASNDATESGGSAAEAGGDRPDGGDSGGD